MLIPSLVSFLRMSSVKQSSVARSQNHGDGRDEDPPDQPSLAEFMLEMERNKRESNRLLARIEENTAHQFKGSATIHDFIRLHPPPFIIPSSHSMQMTGSVASLISCVPRT